MAHGEFRSPKNIIDAECDNSYLANVISWTKENPYKTAALIGFSALSFWVGYSLYHAPTHFAQSGGNGQGLGYVVMLGSNMGLHSEPTTSYQKDVFSHDLKEAIQSRLPNAKFCFVDGVNLQGWRNCYGEFAEQGVTKVNNIIYAHGVPYKGTLQIQDVDHETDARRAINFNQTLQQNLLTSIDSELVLLNCHAGSLDRNQVTSLAFTLVGKDDVAYGHDAVNWIEYLKRSPQTSIPTTADEFGRLHKQYRTAVSLSGGFFADHLPYIAKSYGGIMASVADFCHDVRFKTVDFLWKFS